MEAQVAQILDWGRSTSKDSVRDTERKFDAEALRKALRKAYLDGMKGLFGDYRRGYELCFEKEAIGVTNGSGRFVVYYRKR